MTPLPCPRCGKVPEVHYDGYASIACSDCYDGAPDSTRRHEHGSGLTRWEAIENWNEMVECWEKPENDTPIAYVMRIPQ